MSKLMRISDEANNYLDELNQLTGESRQKILERALQRFAHDQRMKKANEQYAELKKDKKAWREELEERALWDVTLLDGLEDDK